MVRPSWIRWPWDFRRIMHSLGRCWWPRWQSGSRKGLWDGEYRTGRGQWTGHEVSSGVDYQAVYGDCDPAARGAGQAFSERCGVQVYRRVSRELEGDYYPPTAVAHFRDSQLHRRSGLHEAEVHAHSTYAGGDSDAFEGQAARVPAGGEVEVRQLGVHLSGRYHRESLGRKVRSVFAEAYLWAA